MEKRAPIRRYEGPPVQRFFDALRDNNQQDTIRRIREGGIRMLILGLLLRAGIFFQVEGTCDQFAAVIEQSSILQEPTRFRLADTFPQDIDALQSDTAQQLRAVVQTAPAAAGRIISSGHSGTPPV